MPKMLKNSVTYPVTENCTQNQLLPEIIYISEVIIRKSQKKKRIGVYSHRRAKNVTQFCECLCVHESLCGYLYI